MVICLEQGADLHMAQLMPLPLTVSGFSKIQIGFTFLVPAHPGSPGKRVVKRVCVLRFQFHKSSLSIMRESRVGVRDKQAVACLTMNSRYTAGGRARIALVDEIFTHAAICYAFELQNFFTARLLCIRGSSHGPVSVCLSACHKSELY